MALVFVADDAPQRTAPDPLRGNLAALLSGVAWAGTVVGLRWLGRPGARPRRLDALADEAATEAPAGESTAGLATVVAGNLIACLACLPFALPVHGAGTADWLVVLYLGVFQIGLAYLALSTAMPHVPALAASTLLMVEPALNPVWALLVHDERPSALAWTGGAIVVSAALAKTWADARAARHAG